MPTTTPPTAGHHIQCSGTRLNASSAPYTALVRSHATAPPTTPMASAHTNAVAPDGTLTDAGKSGTRCIQPADTNPLLIVAATALAVPMSTIERGFHSNISNSTPSRTAATGVPNTALMPAAAPATR